MKVNKVLLGNKYLTIYKGLGVDEIMELVERAIGKGTDTNTHIQTKTQGVLTGLSLNCRTV